MSEPECMQRLFLEHDFSTPLPPFSRYGVTLTRLAESDLELVRGWRNAPGIRDQMVYREYITKEMQRRWFAAVNNRFNFYSVIHFEGVPVGLSHTKDVDWDTLSGEGGMLIGSAEHQRSEVPFLAALAGTDWMFYEFGLKRITAKVRWENRRAIRYNRALGYVFAPDARGELLLGELTPDTYARATRALRAVLATRTTP